MKLCHVALSQMLNQELSDFIAAPSPATSIGFPGRPLSSEQCPADLLCSHNENPSVNGTGRPKPVTLQIIRRKFLPISPRQRSGVASQDCAKVSPIELLMQCLTCNGKP